MIRRAVAAALASLIAAGCTGLDGPSVSPIATTAADPSPATTPHSDTPTPQRESPAPPANLTRDEWVEVAVDGMELRDIPGGQGGVLGRVPAGATAMVIGDVVEVEGSRWVPIAAPGLPYDNGCVASGLPDVFPLDCPLWRGWLPPGPIESPTLVRAELTCPDEPSEVNELLAIPLGVSVACFGGEELTVQARLAADFADRGCPPDHGATPPWMHPCAMLFFPSRTGNGLTGLEAMVPPSFASCESWSDPTCPIAPLFGQLLEVTGSFDHPESALCAESVSGVELNTPDPVFYEYFCRTRFVLTGLEPVD